MGNVSELGYQECLDLLATGAVGRAAICMPDGPHVIPVNYALDGESVVFRTTPYSLLGTHAGDSNLAFEVDHIDRDLREGWSVVARGRGQRVEDADELERIHWAADPQPWAQGTRITYFRLRWRELGGRRIRRQ